ncbi:MAG: tetratricopeptide repeat protein [Opitutae bacterium]|nr:tetratricopeptide repeat protein [Opitutae bacterium]
MNSAQNQKHFQEGLAHHRAGRLAEAEKIYARLRATNAPGFDVWHLSGMLALQLGRAAAARPMLERALRLKPDSALCAMRLGVACALTGDHPAGERQLRAALKRDPALPEAWNHLGFVLRAQGRPAEARESYERALALKPDYAEVHDRLGALLCEQQGGAAGGPHFRRAVELQPGCGPAWSNLGVTLALDGQLAEARDCFAQALALDPGYEQALAGRALVLERSYETTAAVAAYGELLAKNPCHHEARSARLLNLHYLDGVPREELWAEHLEFAARLPATPAPKFTQPAEPDRRLRVAFLSPDLRNHSVAYFLAPLLRHLDRTQFEVVLYHDHFQFDPMAERLRSLADLWRRIGGLPSDVVERVVRADAPDLLVELAGHTGGNRLPLLARRLAPVQMTYLGYPDTTGLSAIDYRLVDAVTDPAGDADRFAAERLLRFAPTAWAYAPPTAIAEPAAPPSAATGRVTFGCFNNFAKVSDAVLQGWAHVLAAVPGSHLLLKGHGLGDPGLRDNIRQRFARLRVAADRVELLERLPTTEAHLAAYSRVDVALDTFPYHGTTTTCEALWMGVPVVTLAGDRHVSRVGASLLTAAGHPEWVARDWPEYVRLAAALGEDWAERSQLRRSLRGDLRRSALLDHAGQSARFGAALRGAWRGWCATRQSAPVSALAATA